MHCISFIILYFCCAIEIAFCPLPHTLFFFNLLRTRFFPLKVHHGLELVLCGMRSISPVNRCGTTHLGSWASSLLVFYVCLFLLLEHFKGIVMMRTPKERICQCIKYVERHQRVKCNYTSIEGETCLENHREKIIKEWGTFFSFSLNITLKKYFWQGQKFGATIVICFSFL